MELLLGCVGRNISRTEIEIVCDSAESLSCNLKSSVTFKMLSRLCQVQFYDSKLSLFLPHTFLWCAELLRLMQKLNFSNTRKYSQDCTIIFSALELRMNFSSGRFTDFIFDCTRHASKFYFQFLTVCGSFSENEKKCPQWQILRRKCLARRGSALAFTENCNVITWNN